MPATQSREHISFSYDARTEWTPEFGIQFVRRLEGFLQRMETRIEALQDQVNTLEGRVATLESTP